MIGAVNVAYFNKKRELIGDNFDGEGFVAGLIGEGHSIENKNFFIYGAGGAARSISFALAKVVLTDSWIMIEEAKFLIKAVL